MSKTPKGLPSIDELISYTRMIAEKQPNKVYQRLNPFSEDAPGVCVYVEKMSGGNYIPSCILGHGFIGLGTKPELLDEDECGDGESWEIDRVLHRLGYEHDDDDARIAWLSLVQDRQDYGIPWGQAVSEADSRYPEVAE